MKKHFGWLFPFLLVILGTLVLFRGLLQHSTTHLADAYDYPYYAWVLDHGQDFILSTGSVTFATTNAFYPHENSYFFSDLLIIQAIIGLTTKLFSDSPILSTNFVLVVTFLFNGLTALLFWRTLFKSTLVISLVTFITTFSPFAIIQTGHLQMVSFWPLLLILTVLNSQKLPHIGKYKIAAAVLIGALWCVQVFASIYLALFTILVIGLWLVSQLIFDFAYWKKIMVFGLVLGLTSATLAGPVFWKYAQVQKQYDIAYDAKEYVTYAAHASDYLFIPYPTFGQKATATWQALNHHATGEGASYPGSIVVLLSILGLGFVTIKKRELQLSFHFNQHSLFFLGLCLLGLIFSLGPRLSVNGSYVSLPLPYLAAQKALFFLNPIRATARWSILFYLGLTYFTGIGAQKVLKLTKPKKWPGLIVILCLCWYGFELFPYQARATDLSIILDSSHPITQYCQNSHSMLIFPHTQQNSDATLYTNLKHRTSELLRSSMHNCLLVNGYGGFEPSSYLSLEQKLLKESTTDQQAFWHSLDEANIDSIFLYYTYLSTEQEASFAGTLSDTTVSLPYVLKSSKVQEWYLFERQMTDLQLGL